MAGHTKRLLSSIASVALVGFCLQAAPVRAAQAPNSQGYSSSTALSNGALVSGNASDSQEVEIATPSNRSQLLGVIVNPEDALVIFGSGTNQVQVVTSGTVSVQATTANGDIKFGDPLTISPISGVAMRAGSSGKIIGIAQEDFKGDANGKRSVELTDEKGQKKSVPVGTVMTKVGVVDWSPTEEPNSQILNGLRSFIGGAVGKQVSNTQALMAIGVILLALLASGIILFSAVSSSIHSIGRNPLSKGIIRRSLFVMIGLSAIVVIGAGSAVYLILGG